VRFVLWSVGFFVGFNAYWLFLLSSPEIFNALKFSEQPIVINITSSASEALRGLGFWGFYGGNQFGPWITPVRTYLTSPVLVLTGLAIPIAAFVSAWLVRWSYRLYLLLLSVVAVFVSMGAFPTKSPSPFGRTLLWAYDHIPGVAGLRTTYKVTAEINLALAILAGIGVEALWHRAARTRRPVLARAGCVVVVMAILGANGYPLFTGRLYNPARGTRGVPAYWQQALDELNRRDTDYRAFFAPAAYWTTYRWGSIKETVLATDPGVNAVDPLRLPIDQRYGSNLVLAIEQPYLEGAPPQGTAQLLRYLGVRDVVLQNDVDWQRSQTARPSEMQTLLRDPDLRPALGFGLAGQNVVASTSGSAVPEETALRPVEVLTVRDPVPMIRAEQSTPIVVSGDGFGIAGGARAGMLPEGAPLLYSGALSSEDLQRLLKESHPSFLVTDTNRRQVWYFSGPRSPHSYTLSEGETIAGFPTGYLLFGDRAATQSVAEYPGLRTISASAYGAVFGTSPQFRPANAFDGNPATWWLMGTGGDPTGAWIQATFARPTRLTRLTITQPDAWYLRDIRRVRVEFSDGSAVLGAVARGRSTTITFSPRLASSVRVRLASLGPNPVGGRLAGAALTDITIPGLHPAELIRVPHDLFDTASQTPGGMAGLAGAPFTYLFERSRSFLPGGQDEEVRIARRFQVAGSSAYHLDGTVHLNPGAGDSQIDNVLFGPQLVSAYSSSRLLGNPALRASAAIDGNDRTAWVPGGAEGQLLTIRFPRHGFNSIAVDTATAPDRAAILRMRAIFPDGRTATGEVVASNGRITFRFPTVIADRVTLVVDKVFEGLSGQAAPIAVNEVHIPGVSPIRVNPGARLPCTAVVVNLDGRPVSVRPEGSVGQLLDGANLPLGTCQGEPLELTAGRHTLLTGGGLQADSVSLSTAGFAAAAGPGSAPLPAVSATTGWGGQYEVEIRDASAPFYLITGQNWDPKWRASIGGRELGPPVLLDGYAAGWRIDRAGSYTVSVRYSQQRLYTLALIVTGLTLAGGFAVVGNEILRRRRRRRALPVSEP
jgi:arabinofuranan 3-O-arabinosyltransferase